MVQRLVRSVAIVLVASALVACSDGHRHARGRDDPVTTVRVGGLERTFRTYVPPGLPGGQVPLVVVLHGALGTGAQAESSYEWDEVAARHGFVVAYPDGYKRAWHVSADCCGPPSVEGVDDVGFVRRVVATVEGRLSIDPRRVYVAGMSNGGMLAYRLACDTDLFAAVGAVAATLVGDCPHPEPISVVHVHGTADETVPYEGGPGRRTSDAPGRASAGAAVPDLIRRWRVLDGCGRAVETTHGAVTTSAAACRSGRGVTLVTVAGAGHQWPGSPGPPASASRVLGLDEPAPEPQATELIWAFFAVHPG